ncbi:ABC transporter permease [Chryseolinea soli]|nr:ABC transporter permease [Chryseolinea soli]
MKTQPQEPPKLFHRFFRWFCHPALRKYIEGDLLELYDERLKTSGKTRANIRFIIDVLLLFRPSMIRPVNEIQSANQYAMFKSYFKIGWRNLLKNKGYSLINIGGLTTGMAAAMLIGLWVFDEVSYDTNFTNYDRIARVVQNQTFDGQVETWFSQAMQLGPELRNTYGDNFDHVVIGSFPEGHKLSYEEKSVKKSGCFMEPGLAEMLTLKMLSGTSPGPKDLNAILLSQSTAKALFGEDDPIEKTLQVDNRFDVKVMGVYEDLPDNSSFSDLNVILAWGLIAPELEQRVGWGNSWFQCFVQVTKGADMNAVSAKIKDAKLKRTSTEERDKSNPQLLLHPMSRWRLHSDFKDGVSVGGGIQSVWMLGTIGGFVLFLACINFMNLSTARSEKRAKEVGIRKTIGSVRTQLINQFFTESLLVALIAFVFSLMVVLLALPWFNEVSGKRIGLPWSAPWFWFACTAFAIVTGLIAGSYPALYLSAFQPAKVLKGAFSAGRFAAVPRKVLVVVQFTVSVTLIVGTLIVFRQIRFAQDRPIGYAINGCVSVPIKTAEIMKRFEVLRNDLLQTGVVEEIAASESSITDIYTTNSGFEWQGKNPDMAEEFVTIGVTHDFGKTIGWQIKNGRDFSKDFASDSSGFIVNEAAVDYLGFQNPIDQVIKWGENGEWKIIGVVKNMITQSPYEAVRPMMFFLKSNRISFINYNIVNLKLNPRASATEALAKIEPVFKKYDPSNAFEYAFADQEFGKKFSNEKRIGHIAFVFATLAIVISCLGLFGLASFVAEQRTKEIGIRKVMGASVSELWRLLSKDFVFLVAISCVVATPLSFYFMNNWLAQYQYRINISWGVFVMASTGALAITLLTVSFQSIKAALTNPAKSLRSE